MPCASVRAVNFSYFPRSILTLSHHLLLKIRYCIPPQRCKVLQSTLPLRFLKFYFHFPIVNLLLFTFSGTLFGYLKVSKCRDEDCDDFLPWLENKAGVRISSLLAIGNSDYGRFFTFLSIADFLVYTFMLLLLIWCYCQLRVHNGGHLSESIIF